MKRILLAVLLLSLATAGGIDQALEYHSPQVNSVTSVPNSYTAAGGWQIVNGSDKSCTGFLFYDTANTYDIQYALTSAPDSGNTLTATNWVQYDGSTTNSLSFIPGNSTVAHASGLNSYGVWKAAWGPYIGNYTLPNGGLPVSATFTAAGNTSTGIGYMKLHFESWK